MAKMSVERWAELKGMLETLEENIFRLTDREAEFVRDMLERVDEWGERVFVSEKQWAWIRALRDEKCR